MTIHEWLDNELFTRNRDTACWLWPYSSNQDGYGHFNLNGKTQRVSRYVLMVVEGEPPENAIARHSCDVPQCFNPHHLSWGTRSQNVQDTLERGQHRAPSFPGERNPSSRLTEEQVRNIKLELNQGHPQIRLARKFNVSPATICNISTGKRWSHVK